MKFVCKLAITWKPLAKVGDYQRYMCKYQKHSNDFVSCIVIHNFKALKIMYIIFPKDTRYFYCKNVY